MGISRSAEPAVAGIDAFSGLPNPDWPLSTSKLDQLERIWERLPAWSVVASEPPALGYRGCFVQTGERRWKIFGDRVTLDDGRGEESRCDVAREIERMVLDSAPQKIAALLASAAIFPK
jgi:hypothetical protein